jgi:hypothetical protein
MLKKWNIPRGATSFSGCAMAVWVNCVTIFVHFKAKTQGMFKSIIKTRTTWYFVYKFLQILCRWQHNYFLKKSGGPPSLHMPYRILTFNFRRIMCDKSPLSNTVSSAWVCGYIIGVIFTHTLNLTFNGSRASIWTDLKKYLFLPHNCF